MKNAGWLFYRKYYHWLEENEKNAKEQESYLRYFVEHGKFSAKKDEVFFKDESDNLLKNFAWRKDFNKFFWQNEAHKDPRALQLESTYPGILIGSGYAHQTGTLGEFKLGFFFDHTTGLPVLPGSSVKGLLRSAFPGRERDTVKNTKTEFIRALTGKPQLNVEVLAAAVFEGLLNKDNPAKESYLPVYQRDIFHDAFIVEVKDKLFLDDYITPHGSNPLRNPVPVRFMKIGPEVKFQFNFSLHDHGGLSAAEKQNLFINILKTFGIGAKTNVGYGQLT